MTDSPWKPFLHHVSRQSVSTILGIFTFAVLFVLLSTFSQQSLLGASSITYVYYSDLVGNGRVGRVQADGSNSTILLQGIPTDSLQSFGIALDPIGGKIYWTNYASYKILRANLDGTDVEELLTRSIGPLGIALDLRTNQMYWVEPYGVFRSNFNGTDVQGLVTNLVNFRGTSIALDLVNNKIYFTSSGLSQGGTVYRCNLDGTGQETLATTDVVREVTGIALDNGKMYMTCVIDPTSASGGAIKIANLDGTGIVNFLTGLRNPYGITLDQDSHILYWTEDFKIMKVSPRNHKATVVFPTDNGLRAIAVINLKPSRR